MKRLNATQRNETRDESEEEIDWHLKLKQSFCKRIKERPDRLSVQMVLVSFAEAVRTRPGLGTM